MATVRLFRSTDMVLAFSASWSDFVSSTFILIDEPTFQSSYRLFGTFSGSAGDASGILERILIETSDIEEFSDIEITNISFQFDETYYQSIMLAGNWNTLLINILNGNDSISGSSENDTIRAYNGNDTLRGGLGSDFLEGGFGNDRYFVDTNADAVREAAGAGIDTVFASATFSLSNLVLVEVEVLRTTNDAGTAAINLTGSQTNNQVIGNAGANVINGRDGNDTLTGLAGNDTLIGSAGSDRLAGGLGADRFDFDLVSHSPVGPGRDFIADFQAGGKTTFVDRIDLSSIDPSPVAGDQAFVFRGSGGFTGVAGQLRIVQSGGVTHILGEVTGDLAADFQITLTNPITLANLTAIDFIL